MGAAWGSSLGIAAGLWRDCNAGSSLRINAVTDVRASDAAPPHRQVVGYVAASRQGCRVNDSSRVHVKSKRALVRLLRSTIKLPRVPEEEVWETAWPRTPRASTRTTT